VLSLNSEVGIDAGSAQMVWLRGELSSSRTPCALAYFHKPLFSSGFHGDQGQMREMWRVLYEFGVDVVIAAHEHSYERFAPQDFLGRFDSARGIRQFIVGTGGTTLRAVGPPRPNREVHGSCSRSRTHSTAGSSCRPSLAAFRMPASGSVTEVGVRSCFLQRCPIERTSIGRLAPLRLLNPPTHDRRIAAHDGADLGQRVRISIERCVGGGGQ
jgi:hypothetical protein